MSRPHKMDKEEKEEPPSLADPTAPEADHGAVAEEGGGGIAGGVHEAEAAVVVNNEEHPPIPMPPPLLVAQESPMMPLPAPHHDAHEPGDVAMAVVAAPDVLIDIDGTEHITITDQDVLFGRGGLTNRHIGNLRYRDIISIHRQDYVNAQKTEKPNVARRIVKAIRTGKNPGRFLRKGEDGRWHEVSDKEAAWKASQALREKTRWSSMKGNKTEEEEDTSAAVAARTVDSTLEKVVESANNKTVERAKKRKVAAAEDPQQPASSQGTETKKVKSEEVLVPAASEVLVAAPSHAVPGVTVTQAQSPASTLPTEISHITIPPVITLGSDRKVGANYLLNTQALTNTNAAATAAAFPKDEDVLFGRGGRTNHHPGNKRLREIVNKYRDIYNQAKKVDKPKVSKLIVSALRNANPPSRFLRMNEETTQWEDVGDKRAAEKVSQTLREKDREQKLEYLAKKKEMDKHEKATRDAVLHAQLEAEAAAQVRAADNKHENAVREVGLHERLEAEAAAHVRAVAAAEAANQAAAEALPSPAKMSPIKEPTIEI